MTEDIPQRPLSKRFCAPDADLTFLSQDGVLFKVHRANLEMLSEGFSAPAMVSDGEVVPLVEIAAVLELLFQYLYPQRHPDLNLVEFDVLSGLAEAAEKYQVYPALEHCKAFMRNAIPQHAVEVLEFAVKHGYKDLVQEAGTVAIPSSPLRVLDYASKEGLLDLADCAAEQALASPLRDAARILSPQTLKPWLRYYDQWLTVMPKAYNFIITNADDWEEDTLRFRQVCRVYCRLARGPKSLRDLDATFNVQGLYPTQAVHGDVLKWKKQTSNLIKKLKPFSKFLERHLET